MMRHNKFACFILTHGRPDLQHTYESLRKHGYTGKIYLIVDDEDITGEDYKKKYGSEVVFFSKDKIAETTDRGDIIQKKNTVLFARNACHGIAEKLGLEYFLELDDDYILFGNRYIGDDKLKMVTINNLDAIFDEYLDFLDVSGALAVCFAQGGDYIGGAPEFWYYQCMRKAMNCFFCRTDRPFKFMGRMNDDVSTYVTLSHMGKLFFTLGITYINQKDTQSQSGGLTDMYKENGTYMKSFYSVMYCPSAVKVAALNTTHARIHHQIKWNNCAPKLVSSKYQKEKIEDVSIF